jgi:hypothetical protein
MSSKSSSSKKSAPKKQPRSSIRKSAHKKQSLPEEEDEFMGIASLKTKSGSDECEVKVKEGAASIMIAEGGPLTADNIAKYAKRLKENEKKFGNDCIDIDGTKLFGIHKMPDVSFSPDGTPMLVFNKKNNGMIDTICIGPGQKLVTIFNNN